MKFLDRIKQDLNSIRNQQWGGRATLVDTVSLHQLVSSFESLDSVARADHDGKIPSVERTAALVHEIQASFFNLGVEETMDVVMYTIAEIRKRQIKILRREEIAAEKERLEREIRIEQNHNSPKNWRL